MLAASNLGLQLILLVLLDFFDCDVSCFRCAVFNV
jgi:hypothetical protein